MISSSLPWCISQSVTLKNTLLSCNTCKLNREKNRGVADGGGGRLPPTPLNLEGGKLGREKRERKEKIERNKGKEREREEKKEEKGKQKEKGKRERKKKMKEKGRKIEWEIRNLNILDGIEF